MKQPGAVILVPRVLPEAGAGGNYDRLGKLTLLEKLIHGACGAIDHIVIVPEGAPLGAKLRGKLVERASVGEPCVEPLFSVCALGQADGLLPPLVETVAVLTADLPYLDGGHLAQLFDAVPPGADGVCVTEGEDKRVLLGVYRREVLRHAGGLARDGETDEAALWAGLNLRLIPAAGVPGGATGLTIANRVNSPEAYRMALAHGGFCHPAHPAITLELYGNLQIRTGCGALPLRADTVGRAFQVFRAVYPEAAKWMPEHEALPDHFRFSINGSNVTTSLDHPLEENDQLILFSATVGG